MPGFVVPRDFSSGTVLLIFFPVPTLFRHNRPSLEDVYLWSKLLKLKRIHESLPTAWWFTNKLDSGTINIFLLNSSSYFIKFLRTSENYVWEYRYIRGIDPCPICVFLSFPAELKPNFSLKHIFSVFSRIPCVWVFDRLRWKEILFVRWDAGVQVPLWTNTLQTQNFKIRPPSTLLYKISLIFSRFLVSSVRE